MSVNFRVGQSRSWSEGYMLFDLFTGAQGYSTFWMAAAVIWLLLSVVAWVRLGGRGVRRDGDQVLTPLQVLSRVGLEIYGVCVGFFWYVYLIGAQALQEPGAVKLVLEIPAVILDYFIPATVLVDHNLLMSHSAAAIGSAVFVGFLLHGRFAWDRLSMK